MVKAGTNAFLIHYDNGDFFVSTPMGAENHKDEERPEMKSFLIHNAALTLCLLSIIKT